MRETGKGRITVLIADDDEEECVLMARALRKAGCPLDLRFAHDGNEELDFLRRGPELPAFVLLDLNMPRMDGREALAAIKQDPRLRSIPVVVLNHSRDEDEIRECYRMGANSYIHKPATYDALADVVLKIWGYWCNLVELPDPTAGSGRERVERS